MLSHLCCCLTCVVVSLVLWSHLCCCLTCVVVSLVLLSHLCCTIHHFTSLEDDRNAFLQIIMFMYVLLDSYLLIFPFIVSAMLIL